MAIVVNSNIASLNAQRQLTNNTLQLGKAMEKLSSGLRINRAADDAAGLSIADGLRGQVRALNQANRNVGDGISLIQITEGAMGEQASMLTRMRELATESANGALNNSQRGAIDAEFKALQTEFQRVADTTEFNGNNLMKSGGTNVTLQIGYANNTDNRMVVSALTATASAFGINATTLTSVSTVGNAQTAITALSKAINTMSDKRGNLGAKQNRLEYASSNIANFVENLSASESRVRDVDVAAESAQMTKYNILQQAGSAMLAQANQQPQMALSLLR